MIILPKIVWLPKVEKESEQIQQMYNMDDTNGEIKMYHEIITIKVERDNIILWKEEQWLILSKVVNYIDDDRYPKNYYDLGIKAIYSKSHKKILNKEGKRQMLDLDFGNTPEKLKEYVDK